jgi:hypothetical protein
VDRCCSSGGLFLVVLGEVVAEGDAADSEHGRHLLDGLVGGERGPSRDELVGVQFAESVRLFVLACLFLAAATSVAVPAGRRCCAALDGCSSAALRAEIQGRRKSGGYGGLTAC